MKMKLSW